MQGTVHLCIEPPSAPLRSAPLRSVPLCCAPLRSAPLRSAPRPLRSAAPRAAPRRAAPLGSAPRRSAPPPRRSAPLRSAAGQFVPNFFSFPEAARPRKKLELSCRCHWLLFMMLVCVLSSPRRRCRRSWHVSVSLCGDCRVVGGARTRALQGCTRRVCVGAGVPAVRVIARCCVCVV